MFLLMPNILLAFLTVTVHGADEFRELSMMILKYLSCVVPVSSELSFA